MPGHSPELCNMTPRPHLSKLHFISDRMHTSRSLTTSRKAYAAECSNCKFAAVWKRSCPPPKTKHKTPDARSTLSPSIRQAVSTTMRWLFFYGTNSRRLQQLLALEEPLLPKVWSRRQLDRGPKSKTLIRVVSTFITSPTFNHISLCPSYCNIFSIKTLSPISHACHPSRAT